MPQQGPHQSDQLEQVQVQPDQQQIHQQVYHYHQEIQVQAKTTESHMEEDMKPNYPPTIAQTAVSCFTSLDRTNMKNVSFTGTVGEN
jgi:hypothetical protein